MKSLADPTKRIYSSSCLTDFLNCPRLFYYHWIRKLEPIETSRPLLFGSAFHDALLVWYKTNKLEEAMKEFSKLPSSVGDDHRTKEWGESILKEYVVRYKNEPYKIVYLEKVFAVEIGERIYTGRIDAIVDWDKQIYIKDHKTGKSLGLSFFTRHRPSPQIDGYCYACKELVGNCVGALINGISVAKAPKDRFQRDISSRSEKEIGMFKDDFNAWTEEIERCMEKEYYPRHTTHCNRYGKCEFWETCVYGENERVMVSKFKEKEE